VGNGELRHVSFSRLLGGGLGGYTSATSTRISRVAGVSDDGVDLDSAGVYFMSIEEFESRTETKSIREDQSGGEGNTSGSDPGEQP
jgi:hypothetical protein